MIRHGGSVCRIFRDFPKSPGHVYSERDASAVAAGVISLFADSINFRTACVRFIERAFRPLARAGNVPFRIGRRDGSRDRPSDRFAWSRLDRGPLVSTREKSENERRNGQIRGYRSNFRLFGERG